MVETLVQLIGTVEICRPIRASENFSTTRYASASYLDDNPPSRGLDR